MTVLMRITATYHAHAVASCLPRFDAAASINVNDFSLMLRGRNRYFRLEPTFIYPEDGRIRYSPLNRPAVSGFAGWRPYFNKRWPEASTKLPFKDFCVARGLPTPRFDRAGPGDMPAFVIKQEQSSFGRGIRGPFRAGSPAAAGVKLENSYYEEFVSGRILKAYYWDAKLVCLEAQDCPAVIGDGVQTVRQLIAGSLSKRDIEGQWQYYEDMVEFQGKTLQSVLAAGEKLLADCRYQSNFIREEDINANVLDEPANRLIAQQLRDWGPVFLDSIPEDLRPPGTAYTVDAVADRSGKVWLLEMNCNPALHPDVYFGMFEGLLGPASERADSAPATESSTAPLLRIEPFAPAPAMTARRAQEALSHPEVLAVARHHLENGRLEEALRNLKPLIVEPNAVIDALPLAARAYAQLRLHELAQDCYRRYLAARPDALVESLELGLTHFEKGENRQAKELWRGVLQKEPGHPPTLFYSSLLAAREGRVQDARGYLDALLRETPSDNLYVARGRDLLVEIERGTERAQH